MKFYFIGLGIDQQMRKDLVSPYAIEILQKSTLLFIEEKKIAKKKLDLLGINSSQKEIILYNEHTEQKRKKLQQYLENFFTQKILKHKCMAMISDSGYPLFADPGYQVQQFLIHYNIPFTVIAGTNSALHALMLSGMPIDNYYYVGFLPVKDKERKDVLKNIFRIKTVLIFMETPYRLSTLLLALKKDFLLKKVAIVFGITEPTEEVFRTTVKEAIQKYKNKKVKKNFVLVLDNGKGGR